MRVVGLPGAFYHTARHPPLVVSPQAQERLRWLSCWQALRKQGLSSTQASEVLFLPRSTLPSDAEHPKDLSCHPTPPNSTAMWREPKGTHTEEFYQLYDGELEVTHLNRALQEWEWTYNCPRPHQALDWKTPMEYICVRILRMLSIRRKRVLPRCGLRSPSVPHVPDEYTVMGQ